MPAKSTRRRRLVSACLVALIWFAALGVVARLQTTGGSLPPLAIKSVDGRDLFQFYCAACHGKTGVGDGPAAAALRTPPVDLTIIARANGGVFPNDRVRAAIAGTGSRAPTPAHGSREMPVWGPIFRALDPNDALVAVRIGNLVIFLESIQVK
jgi:mono/diheme cytochrome c family protein